MEEKESFQEIGDIMTRHATLAATNENLRQQQQAAAEEIEKIRQGPMPPSTPKISYTRRELGSRRGASRVCCIGG